MYRTVRTVLWEVGWQTNCQPPTRLYIAIPGSSDPNHIAENYDIFDFELSEEDMQCVNNFNRMERYEIW